MSQDLERKKKNIEKSQKRCFGWFVISLFLLAISNTASSAHPVANWLSLLFAISAVVALYCSYKLTP